MRKKSVYYMILISMIGLITTSNFAFKTNAHAPDSMTLDFNLNTQTLNISIVHTVSNPTLHYVNLFTISVNGSVVLSPQPTSQPDTTGGLYQYPISANDGATIQVSARCIEGGSIAACIIVGVGPCGQGGGPGIPGYFGLWVIIGLSIIVSLAVTYKKMRR
ncbi:MAG: hypothetical protein ACXAC5_06575 [Promethearchaeota archaeon]|jgi:hypothetical protein